MELNYLRAALEAVLFAHAEPVSVARLAEVLEAEPALLESLLQELRDKTEEEDRGIQLIQLEGAWQFASKQLYGEEIKKAMDHRRNVPLTPAALEVLAIVAYNQPVSRSFIDQVRGVDSSSTVANLVQKGLIAEAGRMDLPGRPISFRTTDAFLRTFGISSLSGLPPLHSGETQENFSDLYEYSSDEASFEADDMPATRALQGGGFVEGEAGAAAVQGGDA